ncbi:major facilitator superfamily domain-containing protein [Xylariaceae sp. FL0662B]|nr:major facilitator superfamily domain-containing protein [Xylariaceae sp. FL0662B]
METRNEEASRHGEEASVKRDSSSNTIHIADPKTTAQTSQIASPYTVFTRAHKRLLTVIIGVVGLVSPLTANIYLPLLPLLRTQYDVTQQAINLTLTLYVIVAAIMPAIFAPAADTYGRRLVAVATSVVYTVGSLGLTINDALRKSYVALLLMRAVQAFGASASASITYGVVSDVCIPAERGTMIGPTISASNVGTVLGPTLGGLIAWRSEGVEYVFLALTIFGAVNAMLVSLCLPETARKVVGNGGEGKRVTKKGLYGWVILGPRWGLQSRMNDSEGVNSDEERKISTPCARTERGATATQDTASVLGDGKKKRFAMPNPLACLSIMLWKDTSLILWLASCNYAVWYCVTASWPQIYGNIYGWSSLEIGLAYLPSAVTIIVAGLVSGPWMNARYRRTAIEEGISPDIHQVDGFPIERARMREQWLVFVGTHASIGGLGWAIQEKAHPAVLLVLQSVTGFLQSFLFFAFNTLLVDVYPDQPSTASAAASLVRSGLSGIGVALLQPLVDRLDWGWYFSLMALVVGGLQGIGMIILLKYGRQLREKRQRQGNTNTLNQDARANNR